MKKNTSLRLKQLMRERNLKQVDILNMSLPFQKSLNIKMGKSTLSQYVNHVQSPDQDRIYLLSKTLNVNEAWLMGYDVPRSRSTTEENTDDSFIHEEDSTYNYFDIGLSAGILTEVDPFSDDDIEKVKISDVVMGKYAGDKDVFMTNINGQSMNRVIPDKSLIAVKEYDNIQSLHDGDIVVFQDGSEMSVKRFFNDKNNNVIVFNPDSTESFPPIVYQYENLDRLKIIGKVVVYTVEI